MLEFITGATEDKNPNTTASEHKETVTMHKTIGTYNIRQTTIQKHQKIINLGVPHFS